MIQPFKLGLLIAALLLSTSAASAPKSKASARAPAAMSALSRELEELSARVTPAVVQIVATAYGPSESPVRVTEELLGRQRRGGSGAIMSADGFILTNTHVIEGARQVRVLVASAGPSDSPRQSLVQPPGRWVKGEVVGVDRETDLAVVHVNETGLPHLAFGDSDRLKAGQVVLAFGSPMGFANSVTMGVVSAVARQLEPESRMVHVQTDTPINPGNSGGPLVNLEGELVGVNTLIVSQGGGSEGLGFAAPSNIARTVFEQLRSTGRVRRGEIGVSVQTVTPSMAKGLGLSRDWGVIVSDAVPGGPGARGGLEPGDLVRKLDGKVMENGRQFDVNLYRRMPGETVTLEIERRGKLILLQVVVVERPDDSPRFEHLVTPERNLLPKLGVLAADLPPDLADNLPWLRQPTGVLIAARATDAPYTDAGLQPGDVVLEINRAPTPSLEVLRENLARLTAGDAVVLHVNRLGRLLYVAFEVE